MKTLALPTRTNPARAAFEEAMAAAMTPAGLERYRLDRLLELRAVIDSLRTERDRDAASEVRTDSARHLHS